MDILISLAACCTIAGFVVNTAIVVIRIIDRAKGGFKEDDARK